LNKKLERLLPANLRELPVVPADPPSTCDDKELPYDRMPPGQFEKFCCELLQEEFKREDSSIKIIKIEPLAGSGHGQYGADIFVEKSNGNGTWFALYEVKRVKGFDKTDYKKALERFVARLPQWKLNIKEFTVLSSELLQSALIAEWKSGTSRTLAPNIELDIWSSWQLNEKVKHHPALVFKYFHRAWVEILFGKEGLAHFEKYGYYEFEESASWVNYMEPSQGEYADLFTVQNEHIKIQGFLPSLTKDSASCYVELRNGRFSHVMVTLNHRQLVNTYFQGYETPLDSGERKFLQEIFDQKGLWICDLGNCRITLSQPEAECLCDALDAFHKAYEGRLKDREETWKSRHFSLVTGMGSAVPLLMVKRRLLNLLREFACAHDAFDTNTGWSIFDASGAGLKVFTQKESAKYDAGYHVFIRPYRADSWFQDFSRPDDEVLLAWIPPSDMDLRRYDRKIGLRYYWDALTTFNWLKDELIPRALYWQQLQQKKSPSLLKRIIGAERGYDAFQKAFVIEDYVSTYSYLSKNVDDILNISTAEQLLSLVMRMRSHFAGHDGGIFVSEHDYRNLFEALGAILKFNNGVHFGYLYGNLNYLKADDMSSLIDAVFHHAGTFKKWCTNSFRLDCVMRCFISVLKTNTSNIDSIHISGIANLLLPLIAQMERLELLDRQIKRLGPEISGVKVR
jgi:hypothetical protein